MIEKFKNVKVLIWDVDGTFYKLIENYRQRIIENVFQVIMDHTGWTPKKTAQEFYKIYPKKYSSGTKAAAVLSKISVVEAANECAKYDSVEDYLKSDPKIVDLFSQLAKYQHFILMNGTVGRAKKIIKITGLNANIFTEIVTSEKVGVNKPELKGFQYILNKTQLSADEHLMIGDREEVDLVPAKKLGMKTCLVYSNKKSNIADMVLPDIYKLTDYLL